MSARVLREFSASERLGTGGLNSGAGVVGRGDGLAASAAQTVVVLARPLEEGIQARLREGNAVTLARSGAGEGLDEGVVLNLSGGGLLGEGGLGTEDVGTTKRGSAEGTSGQRLADGSTRDVGNAKDGVRARDDDLEASAVCVASVEASGEVASTREREVARGTLVADDGDFIERAVIGVDVDLHRGTRLNDNVDEVTRSLVQGGGEEGKTVISEHARNLRKGDGLRSGSERLPGLLGNGGREGHVRRETEGLDDLNLQVKSINNTTAAVEAAVSPRGGMELGNVVTGGARESVDDVGQKGRGVVSLDEVVLENTAVDVGEASVGDLVVRKRTDGVSELGRLANADLGIVGNAVGHGDESACERGRDSELRLNALRSSATSKEVDEELVSGLVDVARGEAHHGGGDLVGSTRNLAGAVTELTTSDPGINVLGTSEEDVEVVLGEVVTSAIHVKHERKHVARGKTARLGVIEGEDVVDRVSGGDGDSVDGGGDVERVLAAKITSDEDIAVASSVSSALTSTPIVRDVSSLVKVHSRASSGLKLDEHVRTGAVSIRVVFGSGGNRATGSHT